MIRPSSVLLAALAATLIVGSASAAEIYRWKDAKGVVHFSQTPPENGRKYETVKNEFAGSSATAPARPAVAPATTANAATPALAAAATTGTTTAAAANTQESAACKRARENLAVLDGQNSVQMDTDGDGQPDKILSNEERSAQREVAEASIKANCAS